MRTKNKMKDIELWIKKSGEYRPRTLKELRMQSMLAPSPFDGWGMELSYVTDGADYVLSSAGPDMKFETADDITILHKDGKSRFINET